MRTVAIARVAPMQGVLKSSAGFSMAEPGNVRAAARAHPGASAPSSISRSPGNCCNMGGRGRHTASEARLQASRTPPRNSTRTPTPPGPAVVAEKGDAGDEDSPRAGAPCTASGGASGGGLSLRIHAKCPDVLDDATEAPWKDLVGAEERLGNTNCSGACLRVCR